MLSPNSSPSSIWPILRRNLLLGTDQQALAQELRTALAAYQIPEEETEQLLLEALGVFHILHKGAPQLKQRKERISLSSTNQKQRNSCSWRTVQHLQAILQGHHSAALPELVQLLQKQQKALPASSLPDLLNMCSESPKLWPLLYSLLGDREIWLVRQHPLWSQLLPDPELVASWPDAKPKAQAALLSQWREIAPAAARNNLESHWPKLDHNTKARLLPALGTKLHQNDEAFLAQALQEKRKNIRLAAANLLVLLPNSELVEQLSILAAGLLHFTEKKITIELPDEIPKTTQALGIYPTGSKQVGGLKVNWLRQIVARVPFQYWVDIWQQPAATLIPLFAGAEHGDILLQAIAESLSNIPHQEARTALLRWWLLAGQANSWNTPVGKQLLQSATNEQFNDILLFWLQQAGPLVPADSLPAYWLQLGRHTWTPALSKLIVFGFRDVVETQRIAEWSLYHYKQILQAAAYQSEASLLDTFKNGWSFRSAGFARWHGDVEELLQTLHFRLEMQRAVKG